MFRRIILFLSTFLIASCGGIALTQPEVTVTNQQSKLKFVQWDVPHTDITMLLPKGWVSEYYQGTTSIAPDSRNFFYSPYKEFEGVLINIFLSDGPRAVGPSFDVTKLAEKYIATQSNVIQFPILVEGDGRQIVTTLHRKKDTKGTLLTYLAGYVLEDQQLTVFLAATPTDSEATYLPILDEMLYSIYIKSIE